MHEWPDAPARTDRPGSYRCHGGRRVRACRACATAQPVLDRSQADRRRAVSAALQSTVVSDNVLPRRGRRVALLILTGIQQPFDPPREATLIARASRRLVA